MAKTPSPIAGGPGTSGSSKPVQGAVVAPKFQLESTKREKFLKLLIYGDFGVGKTFLAGTSADVEDMRDVLLINAESGDLTLNNPDHSFEYIDVVNVTDFKTVAFVYDFIKLHCKYRDEGDIKKLEELQKSVMGEGLFEPDRIRQYRTVLIDSLTELEAYCMNQLLGVNENTRLDEEVQSAEWSEYKKNHTMMQRLVRNFRDLPMHVIITCARGWVQDESKRFNYSPQMTGKLSNQVQGFMDMVGYYVLGAKREDESIPRRLFVQPTGKFAAKCRFSGYKKDYFDEPTIKSILHGVGLHHET